VAQKTLEQISYNMSRIRDRDTKIERVLRDEFLLRGMTAFTQNDTDVIGKPDFVFKTRKIAVFCDSEFWHGYNWEKRKLGFKSRQDFWIPKIERNMERDNEVTTQLEAEGYLVLRFWGHRIKKELDTVVNEIEWAIHIRKQKIHDENKRNSI
jgi:DNA mismatch endonuclease Vsr